MSYYSGTGMKIRQGAAGVGRYFQGLPPQVRADGIFQGGVGEYFDAGPGVDPPAAMAFQDGVLGGSRGDIWTDQVGTDPGPLMSFHDGSLGACQGCGVGASYEQAAAGIGYPLFIDGKAVESPTNIYHGPVAPVGALRYGPLRAYREGSLGAADPHVVDLTDPDTMKEVKGAVGLFVPELTMAQPTTENPNVGADYFSADFYADPVWGPKAEELWAGAVDKLLQNPNYKGTPVSATIATKGGEYPSASGLAAALLYGVASPGYGNDPEYFAKTFPILHAFVSAMGTAGSASGFSVKEPYFTAAERVKGKSLFAGVSTGMLVAGAVVTGGIAYLLFRKRK